MTADASTKSAPPKDPKDLAPALTGDQPIGVFDSGVGGLTVARAVLEKLPSERLLYLGDTARVPYGMRSEKTVLRYSRGAARFLLKRHVKFVLIACNTASAAALPALRDELSVGVLGAVEPGAESAAAVTKRGEIGVLGTLATIRSGAYERALASLDPALRVYPHACPLLVPLAEEGWLSADDPVPTLVARRYLKELHDRAPNLDTLVLGCTHYPLLKPVLEKVAQELWGRHIALVDSAQAMAQATERELQSRGLLAPRMEAEAPSRRSTDRLSCYVTDEARVAEVGARFLGRPLHQIELVDL